MKSKIKAKKTASKNTVRIVKGPAFNDHKRYSSWIHYEYDADGNMIHKNFSTGYECWYEYDAKGNKIHYKDSDGFERRYKYTYKKIKGKYLIEWELSA